MVVQDNPEGRWVGLTNLMDITLVNCTECDEIPMLGHLPHLKSLYFDGLTNVRSISSSFYGVEKCSTLCSSVDGVSNKKIIVFRALEELQLSGMSNLTEWAEVELSSAAETQRCEVIAFPCLQKLKIERCWNLSSAPSHFPCLKELKICEMNSSLPFTYICGMKLISLEKLKIVQLNELVSLPDCLFSNNKYLIEIDIQDCPNLTHLVPCFGGGGASVKVIWILRCPNLRELPNDLHILHSLEELGLRFCPNLKSIPYPIGGVSQGFASLRDLSITSCEGLTNLQGEMVELCAPLLENLSLSQLSSLTNLPTVLGYLQKMPCLISLDITEVPKLFNSEVASGSLCNVQDLRVGYWLNPLDYVSLKASTLDGILQGGFHSLRRLTLYGLEHWNTLPNQLQHLTVISVLRLTRFGIEALPEWFGNFPSLESLSLSRCKKLRRLPTKEAMRRLTKLKRLTIRDCPILELICIEKQSHDDSEWPKISHIPQLTVFPSHRL